ncbi:hypothetical protein FACS189411_15140 [Bacteroidia bacterium]|nr:hypothetical protein FACS189411_15140 [Bacteroidia bacterium]
MLIDLFEAYSAPATGLYNAYGPNSVSSRAAGSEAEEHTVALHLVGYFSITMWTTFQLLFTNQDIELENIN